MNNLLMKKIVFAIAFLAAGLLSMSSANAASNIATSRQAPPGGPAIQVQYSLGTPVTTSVQPSSWYNPGFGNAGWTHFSKWGRVSLKAGKRYQISVQSSNPKLHPGLTLWQRKEGKKYASPDLFVGHSYIQYTSIQTGPQISEDTGKTVGSFDMTLVTNGYDVDGMQGTPCATAMCWWPSNPSFKPVSDGVAGKLVLDFRAKKTGLYQFVVGGINPDGDKSTTLTGGFNNNSNYVPISVEIKQLP